MNTIITAAIAGLNGPSSGSDNGQLKQGANQTPMPKVWSQHIGNVLAAQLKPTTLVRVVGQGSTNDSLSVSHYGPCPEVPDGHDMKGIVPLIAGTQTKDDFGLPIAGAPAENQKLLQYQTAPGDPYALGISSKSPDGVTSPAIPNSGDVSPGTAASNPASYLTGPVTKQHPWLTDVVAGCGIQQTAYGKYDYTDPTGTVHTALGKGDTKVKKPLLEIKRATNTTPLYSGQVTLAGSSPTEYLHSGIRCAGDAGENHGLVVNTKWGTNIDKDDAVDVWLAASATKPTDGEGDQTARALPCYDGTVYNTSALGLDGGAGHAAYVKHDQKSITQTADGKLRAHAITITHSPPVDADVPATARDGTVVVCTNDNSVWERSSGTWHRLTLPLGGTTGQVLTKINATDYNVDWETPSGGGGGGGGITPAYCLLNDCPDFATFAAPTDSRSIVWDFHQSSSTSDWGTLDSHQAGGFAFDPTHPTRITIPVGMTGIYEIHAGLSFDFFDSATFATVSGSQLNTQMDAQIQINRTGPHGGSTYKSDIMWINSNVTQTISHSFRGPCDAGDYLEVFLTLHAMPLDITNNELSDNLCWFHVVRVA